MELFIILIIVSLIFNLIAFLQGILISARCSGGIKLTFLLLSVTILLLSIENARILLTDQYFTGQAINQIPSFLRNSSITAFDVCLDLIISFILFLSVFIMKKTIFSIELKSLKR